MKKFFTVIPLQPEGKLNQLQYDTSHNPDLAMAEATCFPIFYLLKNCAEKGEEVILYAIRSISQKEEENANSARNLGKLKAQLAALQQTYGFDCQLEVIDIKKIETPTVQARYFLMLMNLMEQDDDWFCCITFGEKPMPIVLFGALSYAAQARKGFRVMRVCYGQVEHTEPKTGTLYDVTPLFSMHHMATDALRFGVEDPDGFVKAAFALADVMGEEA